MKIKYHTGEVDVKDSEELADHFIDVLGYSNDPLVQAYADLLFKIHELIKNCDRYIGCSELESLLEDEGK